MHFEHFYVLSTLNFSQKQSDALQGFPQQSLVTADEYQWYAAVAR